jgi:hypothetical protein
MTEARPLLACECVECPSHRAERKRRLQRIFIRVCELERERDKARADARAAEDAGLDDRAAREAGEAEIARLEARVAALTAAIAPTHALSRHQLPPEWQAHIRRIQQAALDAAAGGA